MKILSARQLPKPNPEVYRLAAEMIEKGQQIHTCFALNSACRILSLSEAARYLHKAQYLAAFAPLKNPEVIRYSDARSAFYCNGEWSDKDNAAHPFWNRRDTPEARQTRVLALLLMADIVESPNV